MHPAMMSVVSQLHLTHADEDTRISTPTPPDPRAPHLPWLEPTPTPHPPTQNGLSPKKEEPIRT